METITPPLSKTLTCLSIVIPARDEEASVASTVQHLHLELSLYKIPHEIVVVDDGSTDATWEVLQTLAATMPELRPVKNSGPHGFGRAVICGIDVANGDAVVVMMADESDDCRDVVRYWDKLNEGYEAVFGSRFIIGWRRHRLSLSEVRAQSNVQPVHTTPVSLQLQRHHQRVQSVSNDHAQGLRPFLAPHFNLTVELPLKTIVRGYSWTVIPITWTNRRVGVAKLKIKEMGARYMFIVLYVWLEKYFSRGDFRKSGGGA